jgi:hypothetical protein
LVPRLTHDPRVAVGAYGALIAGWILMPLTLFASLVRPRLRYALVVPASLVTIALLAIVAAWPPASRVATAGWMLMTTGIAMGGALGIWFWFRLLPVPPALDHPFSRARWTLVGIHVALIVAGILLAATPLLAR